MTPRVDRPLLLEWTREEGRLAALFDGVRIEGPDVRGIHEAVLADAARRAAESPGRSVTIQVRDGGAEQGRWLVSAHGAVTAAAPDDRAARTRRRDPAAERRRRPRDPRRPRRRIRPPAHAVRALIVLTVACVTVALALGVWTLRRGGDTTGVSTVRGERMEAAAPLEWSADSLWRTPALLPEAGRVLVAGDGVAFVTTGRSVVLVEAASGKTRWSAPYPAGDPRTDLTVSQLDNREVIVVHVGDRLDWWDLQTGQPGGLDLPAGSAVVLRGTAPLVVSADGKTAGLVREGRLHTSDVPSGATALACRADGVITAAGSAGWWHLTPGRAPAAPRPWEVPGGSGTPSVVSYLGGSILTMLAAGQGSPPQILVFTDRDEDVRFAWIGPGIFDEDSTTWHPSPSRNWGVLGRTLVDLDAGRTTDLGRWTTHVVSADRALGELAGQRVLAGPAIPLGILQQGESFPEDLTDAGALVRSKLGPDEVVYQLPATEEP